MKTVPPVAPLKKISFLKAGERFQTHTTAIRVICFVEFFWI